MQSRKCEMAAEPGKTCLWEQALTAGNFKSLFKIKAEWEENADLNVENVKGYCSGYNIELVNGTTFKCTKDYDLFVYYAVMDLNGDTLTVNKVDVYTEKEYNDLMF